VVGSSQIKFGKAAAFRFSSKKIKTNYRNIIVPIKAMEKILSALSKLSKEESLG